MVNEGKARLFKNTQGRYMIYLPVSLAEDSMFPFKISDFRYVKVGFKNGEDKLVITEWNEPEEAASPEKQPITTQTLPETTAQDPPLPSN